MKCLNCGVKFKNNSKTSRQGYGHYRAQGFHFYCSDRCYEYLGVIKSIQMVNNHLESPNRYTPKKEFVELAKKRLMKILANDKYSLGDFPRNIYQKISTKPPERRGWWSRSNYSNY